MPVTWAILGSSIPSPALCEPNSFSFPFPILRMDPTQTELKTFLNIDDICTWIGLDDVENVKDGNGIERLSRSSFLSCLGSPALVRQLVQIPTDAWATATASWEV